MEKIRVLKFEVDLEPDDVRIPNRLADIEFHTHGESTLLPLGEYVVMIYPIDGEKRGMPVNVVFEDPSDRGWSKAIHGDFLIVHMEKGEFMDLTDLEVRTILDHFGHEPLYLPDLRNDLTIAGRLERYEL